MLVVTTWHNPKIYYLNIFYNVCYLLLVQNIIDIKFHVSYFTTKYLVFKLSETHNLLFFWLGSEDIILFYGSIFINKFWSNHINSINYPFQVNQVLLMLLLQDKIKLARFLDYYLLFRKKNKWEQLSHIHMIRISTFFLFYTKH